MATFSTLKSIGRMQFYLGIFLLIFIIAATPILINVIFVDTSIDSSIRLNEAFREMAEQQGDSFELTAQIVAPLIIRDVSFKLGAANFVFMAVIPGVIAIMFILQGLANIRIADGQT